MFVEEEISTSATITVLIFVARNVLRENISTEQLEEAGALFA